MAQPSQIDTLSRLTQVSRETITSLKKYEDIYLLELFHGPTLAFKDIALQVIGNMYEKFLLNQI